MILDKNLTGRSEKRLPIMVVVRLSALADRRGEVEEQTYTDNLSSGGVRVCSLHRWQPGDQDRKSTRLNSSHLGISYAVFCLKKKKKNKWISSRQKTDIQHKHNRIQ